MGALHAVSGRLRSLFKETDGASVVIFRIAFGALMIWETWRYFDHGWISRYYIDPTYNFTYWGFEWVQPWSGNGMYIHFYIMGILALFIMLGLFYRLSAVGFFLSFTYVFLLEQTHYLNHFYLICLVSFLLIFVPAHRSWSLDAWAVPQRRSDTVPLWSVWILRFIVGVPYFFGGIAKLNGDWFRGQPLSMWIEKDIGFPLVGHLFAEQWMGLFLSYAGLLLDFAFVPLLLWKKTRLLGYLLALMFNLMNMGLFSIGIFPWFMIAGTTIFFDSDWPKKIARRFVQIKKQQMQVAPSALSVSERCVAFVMISFVVVQTLLPFRHFLYPGSVHWTEEGHRFAWHMKLRSKSATAVFTVRNPSTGEEWEIDSNEYLNERQKDKMESRPYLVLQFAHYLKDVYRQKGYPNVEVFASVTASLNGRPRQVLINDSVDLAAQVESFRHKDWILPLTEPLPSE